MHIKEELRDQAKAAKIAELNDSLRRTFNGGRVMLTSSVAALPDDKRLQVLTAVSSFTDFSEDNDPHGEHDFGQVKVDEEQYWFKIDYYDLDERYLSDDPSDPKITKRVMVIGAPDEY